MRRLATVGVTYVSLIATGLFAGCGDNKPPAGTGGAGGAGAVGGAGGGAGGAGGGSVGPACTISKPVITATHPALNGVPVANGGDDVASAGGAYEAAFEVTTAVEDGQPVSLTIVNSATPTAGTMAESTAMNGKATFAGVPLTPDGTYVVTATCTAKSGMVGHSAATTFPVDSTPPALTISSPTAGQFFGPGDLVNGAFKVCAQTSSPDAVALPATLGAAAKNLSVAVGTASPDAQTGFAAVTAVGTDACVNVACPSNSPVDLTVTLKDAAGNPTVKTISQVSCATTLPGVLITSPAGDSAPFSDPTKHLLAASSTNTLKDQDAVTPGAQFTVVACSDTPGMATLKVGTMGGALAPLGVAVATVAAVPADNCPTGHTQVAKFASYTLPESALNADGSLSAATALEVDVQDASSAIGVSPEVDLWVDSVAPTVTASATAPICNTDVQSSTAVTKDVTFDATVGTVVLTATPLSGTAMMYSTPTFASGAVTFASVAFPLGETDLTAVATDKAGNTGSLAQPCAVTVGTPPVVTFTAPLTGKNLCASTTTTVTTCVPDADGTMAGWQGPLTVNVTVDGSPAPSGTVTFTASSATPTTLGTANIMNGVATLPSVTIPDGNPVTLTATTSALGVNGVGMASRMLIVASALPAAPTNLQVAVKDRRQTSFTVTWTAPAGAASYDLRYYEAPINPSLFPVAAIQVPITGTPLAAGMTESRDVTDLTIEHTYYFAILAKDAAGNSSDLAYATPMPAATGCTTAPCPIQATFNQTVINGPQSNPGSYAGFGYYVDGSGNFVGDTNSDILAGDGYGNNAYIFAGSATFTSPTPAVTFTGSTPGLYFGSNIANLGDVDGDGLEDIGIASGYDSPPKIYIFKGRANWPATVMDTAADYVITVDSTFDSSSFLGYPIVKLGDINGDGVGDFALGANAATPGGAVLVIYGAMPFGGAAQNLSAMLTANRAQVLTNSMASSLFGASITALGGSNGTLVVGAPAAASGAGQLVSYKWNGTALAPVGTAFTGPTAPNPGHIGSVLGVLGAGLGVISGNNLVPLGGNVSTFLDGTLAMPLTGMPKIVTDTNGQDTFGTIAFGGGFSGSNVSISYVGDSKPDLVVGGAYESSHQPTVYIIDGASLATLDSPINVAASATTKVQLPADWQLPFRATAFDSPVKDVNGDGYGDFAIGETDDFTFNVPFQGQVIVFW